MTDFSYVTINGPEITYGFSEFQPFKAHHAEIVPMATPVTDEPSADIPDDDALADEPTPDDTGTDEPPPAPDHIVVDTEEGIIVGTAGADAFTFDRFFEATWIVIDFEVGKDKIMLDHNLFAGLPLGQLDPSLLTIDSTAGEGLYFDGASTLAYNGQDIAVLTALSGQPFDNFTASDIFVF